MQKKGISLIVMSVLFGIGIGLFGRALMKMLKFNRLKGGTMRLKILCSLVILSLLINLIGCASMMHGRWQDVRVTSNPSGAIVRVGNTAVSTPGVLHLDRKQKYYTLTFEKEGYRPVEINLRRTIDGWLFGNLFFIFYAPIGIIIDFSSGAAYKITPSQVDVVFGEESALFKKTGGDIVIFADMEYLKEKGITLAELQKYEN